MPAKHVTDAHGAVNRAVKSGELVRPEKCQKCELKPRPGCDGRTTIHAHHVDYEKPLDVEWLCAKCHRLAHPVKEPRPRGQHERYYTDLQRLAARDARRESMLLRPVGLRDDNRQPGRLLLDIGSVVIDLELHPDPRDVRMWRAYRDGEPYLRGGLERIWRRVQSEIAAPLGRAHWG